MKSNPFLATDSWLPNYDAMTPELAREAIESQLAIAAEAFPRYEATVQPTWQSLFIEGYLLTKPLLKVWGLLSHLLSVVNSDELRKVEEDCQPKLIAFFQQIGQSKPIYDAMVALLQADAVAPCLNGTKRRILTAEIRSMTHSGVALEGEVKAHFNELQLAVAKLSMDFNNNVLDAVKNWELVLTKPAEVDGMKPDFLARAAEKAGGTPEAGPWKLSLDYASFSPVMQYAKNRSVREAYLNGWITRAATGDTDNTQIIEDILKTRQEIAKILGFDCYADLSLSSKMAPSCDAIESLLGELVSASKAPARKEKDDLTAFAKANGFTEEVLQRWDIAFWSERQREAVYAYDAEALRAYFPLEHVMQGLFNLINRLFGVTFVQRQGEIHAWHKDVRFYDVLNADGSLRAGFYFDPYVRPGTKNGGAWMNEVHTRDGISYPETILPIALVVCNQTAPMGDEPATMRLDEVVTLFHEMGHALQFIMTTIDEPQASGIGNVEWDAVEIASQFLENFCYDKATLTGVSNHTKTGEALPAELFDKIYASRNYQAALATLRQCNLALTDLRLHTLAYPSDYPNANAMKETVAREILIDAPLAQDRQLNSFTHIFSGGYCAGYYGYKWSETLSADVYMAFEEVGLTNDAAIKALGEKYRDTFLALGGSKHPLEIFKVFRGREPNTQAILKLAGLI